MIKAISIALILTVIFGFARANEAVIVGVSYPKKILAEQVLTGTKNDAEDMAKALTAKGFDHIQVLTTPEQTTKESIRRTLDDLRKKPGNLGHFVFYFSGHGRSDPSPGLVPSDGTETPEGDIKPEELEKWVSDIKGADSHTIILDACYSAAMAKAGGVRIRSIRTQGARMTSGPPPNRVLPSYTNSDPNCYYSACQKGGVALETDDPSGRSNGVFTKALVEALTTESNSWADLDKKVHSTLQDLNVGGTQKPVLTPSFFPIQVFGISASKVPPKPPKRLLDLWAMERSDPSFTLDISPSQAQYIVGSPATLSVHAPAGGYFVVIGFMSGRFQTLFPPAPEGEFELVKWSAAAKVDSQALSELFYGDGRQEVRAFWFSTEPAVRQLLAVMHSLDLAAKSDADLKPKDTVATDAIGDGKLLTATLTPQLADYLLDGSEVLDWPLFVKSLDIGSDFGVQIQGYASSKLASLAAQILKSPAPPSDRFSKSLLIAYVNSCFDSLERQKSALATSLQDSTLARIPAGQRDAYQSKFDAASSLNLFRALFPGAIGPATSR